MTEVSDMLSEGVTHMHNTRNTCMVRTVTYKRTGQEDKSVPATPGKTDVENAAGFGATIKSRIQDWLIGASLLGLEPMAGDVIVDGGTKYEVMDLPNENCWRWTGDPKITYRIHTKETGTDDE